MWTIDRFVTRSGACKCPPWSKRIERSLLRSQTPCSPKKYVPPKKWSHLSLYAHQDKLRVETHTGTHPGLVTSNLPLDISFDTSHLSRHYTLSTLRAH